MIWERKLGTALEISSVFGGREKLWSSSSCGNSLPGQAGSPGASRSGRGPAERSPHLGLWSELPVAVTLGGVGCVLCPPFPCEGTLLPVVFYDKSGLQRK